MTGTRARSDGFSCNYITGEVEFDLCTGAEWVPLAAPEDGPRTLAVLDPQPVATGIRYASPLSGRKSTLNSPWEGVQIEGGSIFGAYPYGVSRYRSSSLPETLTLNVPKDHVANALALFRRLDGQVEVLETEFPRLHQGAKYRRLLDANVFMVS